MNLDRATVADLVRRGMLPTEALAAADGRTTTATDRTAVEETERASRAPAPQAVPTTTATTRPTERVRGLIAQAEARNAKPRDPKQANRGAGLEKQLEATHRLYARQGLAFLWKYPTPVRQIGPDRWMRAESKVCDFIGALGGNARAVALEAKESDGERFPFGNVTDTQITFMKQWPGLGLLVVFMHEGRDPSAWLIKFESFLAALDAGARSWPLPNRTVRRKQLKPEQTLADVGVRLRGFDWYRSLEDLGRITPWI